MKLANFKKTMSYKRPWVWLLGVLSVYAIAGFIAVPWVLKNQAQSILQKRLDLVVEVERARFNPFTFTLNIEGLSIIDKDGTDVFGFQQFLVNYEPTGVLRRAWSFKEVSLIDVYSHFERFDEQTNNISNIVARWAETASDEAVVTEEDDQQATSDEQNLPRLVVQKLKITLDYFELVDHVPATVYKNQFGPWSVEVNDLATIPGEVGEQSVNLVTDNGASINWHGSVAIAPIESQGAFEIKGPHFQILSDYMSDTLNFEVAKGEVDLSFNYALTHGESGTIVFKLDQINGGFNQLELLHRATGKPLYSLQTFNVVNGQVMWPEKQIAIEKINFNKGELWLSLLEDGQLDLTQLVNSPETSEQQVPAEEEKTSDDSSAWIITNNSIAFTQWNIHFADQTLEVPAEYSINALNILLSDISNEPEQKINYEVGLTVDEAIMDVNGSLQILPLAKIESDFALKNLPLKLAQPYVDALASVSIDGGALNVDATVTGEDLEDIKVQSNILLSSLEVNENVTNLRLLGVSELSVNNLLLSTQQRQAEIENIIVDGAFVDFNIAEDGTTTIHRVSKLKTSDTDDAQTKQEVAVDGEQKEAPFKVSLGKLQVNNAAAHFADASLPLPFDTRIVKLGGNVSSYVSDSQHPAEIDLEGQVDEHGLVQINGTISPVDPMLDTQIKLRFENMDIPNFSPYTVKFAGREIETGRMNLDLNYQIEQGKLNAGNKIALNNLQLGKQLEQPGAMDLPLDMAIALLKDASGNINLNFPISGNVDDPSFNYGSVVRQAFSKVITGIVTSPFRLLGKLAGSSEEDIGHIEFQPGRSDLTPPQIEKLKILKEALAKRPELLLSVPETFNKTLDVPVLQEQMLEVTLAQEFDIVIATTSKNNKKYVHALEGLYKQNALVPTLADVKDSFEVIVEGKQTFDSLAYANALFDAVKSQFDISESELSKLGGERAKVIQDELVLLEESLAKRVSVVPSAKESKSKNGIVELELGLKL